MEGLIFGIFTVFHLKLKRGTWQKNNYGDIEIHLITGDTS